MTIFIYYWILFGYISFTVLPSGYAISCYACDKTSSVSYVDANEQCNLDAQNRCSADEEAACMLEGYMKDARSFRIVKKCVKDCPLYINTTAQVVRCCTNDDCNRKFQPVPAKRGPSPPPIRKYNDVEPRYDVKEERMLPPKEIGVVENDEKKDAQKENTKEKVPTARERKPVFSGTPVSEQAQMEEPPVTLNKIPKHQKSGEKSGKKGPHSVRKDKVKVEAGQSKSLFASEHKKRGNSSNGVSSSRNAGFVLELVLLCYSLIKQFF